MADLDGLPVVFGITGHRDIRPEDEPVLTAAVRGIFERFRTAYPNTPLVLLSPLAVGADRLVARVAIALEIPFRVPMPLEEAEYRKDFDAAANAEFDELLAAADGRYAMPFADDNDATNVSDRARRARQYSLVGTHVARVSHVLIALWNGKVSESVGGTASVVDFRRYGTRGTFEDRSALLDAPLTGAVYQVVTPRRSDPQTDRPAGTIVVKTRRADLDEAHDPFAPLYARIERFNRDRAEFRRDAGAASLSLGLKETASKLASRFQTRYRRALDLIYVSTTFGAIALAFAHADTPRYTLALAYCALIAVAYAAYVVADRGAWKDRSIEYRALEMGMLIQHVWDTVGLGASAADFYLRIQRSEFDWIRDAIRTVHHLEREAPPDTKRGVVVAHDFVAGQRAFFASSSEHNRKLCERFERVTDVAFWLGGAATLVLLVVSIGHLLPTALSDALAPALSLVWRHGDSCIRAIAVFTIVAAVSHEYAVRRAFHTLARRYAAVLQLYERALEILDAAHDAPFVERLGVTREVIREVGKEALAENGEWLLMQRELPVELLHV